MPRSRNPPDWSFPRARFVRLLLVFIIQVIDYFVIDWNLKEGWVRLSGRELRRSEDLLARHRLVHD